MVADRGFNSKAAGWLRIKIPWLLSNVPCTLDACVKELLAGLVQHVGPSLAGVGPTPCRVQDAVSLEL